jgi:arylsulfatase
MRRRRGTPRAPRRIPWLLASVLAPVWLACSEQIPRTLGCGELAKTPAPDGASVVLVLNDTMRRDRMSLHGGPARTPHFDRFARANLWFAHAVAQAPWTKPSIATLFTSLYPTQHGVKTHPSNQLRAGQELGRRLVSSDRLPEAAETLAEAYRAVGVRTAGFVANPWIERRFGFAQGFEHYDDSFARWGVPGEQVMDAALAWLATLDPGERFFLYVHTIDTHRPYPALTWEEVEDALREPPPAGAIPSRAEHEITQLVRLEGPHPPGARAPAKRRVLRRAYDKGIERFDEAFGGLLHGLARDPRHDRMAIVVTSDHGEALYRRGYGGHGRGLYQSELAVPLAVQLPGARPGRVDCRIGLIDLMPSLCDWNELPCPDTMAGRSWFQSQPGADDLDDSYLAEATVLDDRHRAVYDGRYKLLYKPGSRPEAAPPPTPWSLFDLRQDPDESHDLLAGETRPPAVAQTFASLRRVLAERRSEALLDPGQEPVDRELEDRLRSLGYLE